MSEQNSSIGRLLKISDQLIEATAGSGHETLFELRLTHEQYAALLANASAGECIGAIKAAENARSPQFTGAYRPDLRMIVGDIAIFVGPAPEWRPR